MKTNDYRAIMRHQAGAVALICTGEAGERFGLTATAVCSVTDDPPTVLVCVNRGASAHDVIAESGVFSVNLLAAEHQKIAGIFAGQSDLNGEERFNVEGYEWHAHASGTPWLGGAVAHLDCRVTESHQFSTHTIFLGEVLDGDCNDDAEPLLYVRGQFSELASD